MIDLLDLPTHYEVKKIFLYKEKISSDIHEQICYPITFNIISFDNQYFSLSFDSIEEISEGLSSACESICNGMAFIIKDANTEVTQYYRSIDEMEYIYHNGTYMLQKQLGEILNVYSNTSNIDESFLRKYEQSFKMNNHQEVNVAFKQMAQGEFFYKSSLQGKVKFIYMRADQNKRELQYYSRKELIKRIPFRSILSIKFGVNNDALRNTFKNRFSDSSLTLIYKDDNIFSSFLSDKELHLNFRSERQYDLWGTGFKALYNIQSNQYCSKKDLLQHSRLFNIFYSSQEFQLIDTFFNNSELYHKHVPQSCTYETTLLNYPMNFCFEKQKNELKRENQLFESLVENMEVEGDLEQIIPIIFRNVLSTSQMMVQQIIKMKQLKDDYQMNNVNKAKEVDLLEIYENQLIENQENLKKQNSDLSDIKQQINYLKNEVLKYQYRLNQALFFLFDINIKLKKQS